MQVDAVEQGPGNLRPVLLDLERTARAAVPAVAEVPAGTRVHGRDEQEPAREDETACGAADGHLAVFERLAQDFERGAFELRQFVEEEHAVVREADLARLGIGAAADESGVADRVVRRAEGPPAEERRIRRKQSEHGVDLAGLERLLLGHRRQDARHALREHALAGAGRADEDDVVTAGRRDLEGAFGRGLTLDLGEIRDARPVRLREDRAVPVGEREQFARERPNGVRERVHGVDPHVRQHGRGFPGVFGGHDERADARSLFREERGWQHALHRADAAVQCEFAQDHGAFERSLRERSGGRGQRERDRQVERRPFLADVGGREVHEREALRVTESGGIERAADAFAAFPDRRVGQAHDGDAHALARAGIVDLDLDGDGVDPEQGGGTRSREHGHASPEPVVSGSAGFFLCEPMIARWTRT